MAKTLSTANYATYTKPETKKKEARTPFDAGIEDSLKTMKQAVLEACGRWGGTDIDGNTHSAEPYSIAKGNTLWKVVKKELDGTELVEITWKIGGAAEVPLFEGGKSKIKVYNSSVVAVLTDMYNFIKGLKEGEVEVFDTRCISKYVPKSPAAKDVGVASQLDVFSYDAKKKAYVLTAAAEKYVRDTMDAAANPKDAAKKAYNAYLKYLK